MVEKLCELAGGLRQKDEEEACDHGREIDHADAWHEAADRREDWLRDLMNDHPDRVLRAHGEPGKDDTQEYRDYQRERENLDEDA